MEPIAFAAASLSLLATPGPTNTLLATSGAARGVRRSVPLLAVELAGYLIAILVLRTLVGPLVASAPVFECVLRAAVSLYLLHLAVKLWQHGARESIGGGPVSFARVFVTTLTNPKALIFAFTILPAEAAPTGLWTSLAMLAAMIVSAGGAWIITGAVLRRGLAGAVPARVGYRLSALALALLAGVVSAEAFGAV